MRSLKAKLGILAAALMLSGCMQATTYQAAPRPRSSQRTRPSLQRRVIKRLPWRNRSAVPSSIITAANNRARSWSIPTTTISIWVQDSGKAIRYGITVGEEALAFSGIARVGNMAEWPKWTPTADIRKRIEGLPASVPGGVDNPLGARALYPLPGQPGHTVPDSRHQPAGIYRRVDLLGLHSHDQ